MKRLAAFTAWCAVCAISHARAEGLTTYSYGAGTYQCFKSPTLGTKLKDASASAAMIFSAKMFFAPHSIAATWNSLCPGNPVAPADQPRVPAPTCSASMISGRRLITAAHCLKPFFDDKGKVDTARLKILSGYVQPLQSDEDNTASIATDTVHGVAKVLYCRRTTETDVAVLELSQSIAGARLSRRSDPVQEGEAAHLISFPLGLPLTISTCSGWPSACEQARVHEVATASFRAPLDSFHGSSGGAVVDDDGRLIGIFRGGPEQLTAKSDTCSVSIVHPDKCAGDLVSRVDLLPGDLFDDAKEIADVPCVYEEDKADYSPHCSVAAAPGTKTQFHLLTPAPGCHPEASHSLVE